MPDGKPMIRDCVSRFGKLTVALFCQVLILCLLAFLECQVLIAHYQTTESALRLLGFESRPLAGDKLLGPYFGAVFGEASLSQMLAWVIVLVVAMGSCYVLAKIYALVELGNERVVLGREWRAATAAGDPGLLQAISRAIGAVNTQIWLAGIEFAIVAALVSAACWYDMQLNFFRAIAEAYGLDETSAAVRGVLRPDLEFKRNGTWFALSVIGSGVWGFTAAMVLAALMLKLCVRNIADRWNQWCDAGGELVSRAWNQAAGEAREPAATAESAHMATGETRGEAPLFAAPQGPAPAVRGAANRAAENNVNRDGTAPSSAAEVEVIGGAAGERVTREQARRDPRYFVDQTTGDVWNARHRRELFGEGELPKAA